MLLFLSVALAHVPHDIVAALAVPGDPSLPQVLLATPHGEMLMAKSDDQGRSWTLVGAPPQRDLLADLVWVGDTLVALGGAQVWWSEDRLQRWSSTPQPGGAVMAEGGDTLVLGGEGGLWEGPPSGPWTQVWTTSVRWLGDGVLIAAGDEVVQREGSTWTSVAIAPDVTRAVRDVSAGELWIGHTTGAVSRYDGAGGWSACAPLPDIDGLEHPSIVAMAARDGALVVAPASMAPVLSLDGCQSWVAIHTPAAPEFGLPGGPVSEAEAWTHLHIDGSELMLAGWDGVFISDNLGESWVETPVLPPALVRSLAFSPNYATDQTLLLGSYAAGVLRYREGGATIELGGIGALDLNVQTISYLTQEPAGRDVHGVIGHQAYLSSDGGLSWESFGPTLSDLETSWYSTDGRFWVFGPDIAEVSEDNGANFASLPELLTLLDGAVASSPVAFDGRVCVGASGPARVLCADDLADWELVWEAEETELGGLLFRDGELWAASTRTVAHEQDGAWPSVRLDDRIRRLAAADDGTLYLASGSGRVWASPDGVVWEDLGVQLPGPAFSLNPLPQHSVVGGAVVGNHDGAFLVSADGAARLVGDEWIDTASEFVSCSLCPAEMPATGTIGGALQPLAPGVVLSAPVRGTRLTLYGIGDPGSLRVTIDDVEQAGTRWVTQSLGAVWELDGLDDGWHTLSVTADSTGLGIDSFRTELSGVLLPSVSAPDDSGGWERPPLGPGPGVYTGGCANVPGTSSFWWGILPLLGALSRRRAGSRRA